MRHFWGFLNTVLGFSHNRFGVEVEKCQALVVKSYSVYSFVKQAIRQKVWHTKEVAYRGK